MLKYTILDFAITLSLMGVFWLGYNLNVVQSRRKIRTFFIMVQILLVLAVLFGKNSEDVIIHVILYEIAFGFFVRNHYTNKERLKVFLILEHSCLRTIMFSGLSKNKSEEYDLICRKLRSVMDVRCDFEKKPHLYISYTKGEIIIRYLFSRKQDYEIYLATNVLEQNRIQNLDIDGEVVGFEYICELTDTTENAL